jgi:hypothetical protein
MRCKNFSPPQNIRHPEIFVIPVDGDAIRCAPNGVSIERPGLSPIQQAESTIGFLQSKTPAPASISSHFCSKIPANARVYSLKNQTITAHQSEAASVSV